MQKPSKIEVPLLVVALLLMLLAAIPVIHNNKNNPVRTESAREILAQQQS